MTLGASLVGGLLNSIFSPSLNEGLHVDANGNFTDAQGNRTTPYKNPNILYRALSPASQQAYMANQAYKLAPVQAQQTEAIQEATQGKRFGNLPSDYFKGTPLEGMSPAAQAIASNDNPAYSNLNPITSGKARIDTGVPQMEANEAFNSATAGTEEAKNRAVNAATRGLLGSPALGAGVENQGLNLQSGQLAGETALLPSKLNLEGLNVGNETLGAQGLRQRYPLINDTALGQAGVENAVTGEGLRELPNTLAQMHNSSVFNTEESEYRPYISPFGRHVFGNTVENVKNPLGVYVNKETGLPMSDSILNSMTGGLGAGSGAKTITTPSGITGTGKPMYTAPTGVNDTVSPSGQSQNRGNGGLGATAFQGTGAGGDWSEEHHGGASTKTDDYESLIHEASKAAITYGYNSPQYTQAIAKIHSIYAEKNPSVPMYQNYEGQNEQNYNPGLGFALGTVPKYDGKAIGKYGKKLLGVDARMASTLPLGIYHNVLKPFYQGLTAPDEE